MNVPQLRKMGRILCEAGIITEDKEVMNFIVPLPDCYFLDILKLENHIKEKYSEYGKANSMKEFFISEFGKEFTSEFENML